MSRPVKWKVREYVVGSFEWTAKLGCFLVRVQDAGPDADEGPWYNWQIAPDVAVGAFREDLRLDEGGAPTIRGAKRAALNSALGVCEGLAWALGLRVRP